MSFDSPGISGTALRPPDPAMHSLTRIITSDDSNVRNEPLDLLCREASADKLLSFCQELDAFRRRSENLYERV
ncbi:MAG TPA: hypothetical protein VJW76_17115, partial [Verrucomicrobiae bacterium]|nr:hypothetical protein [Verrucomicrobiae bacterium]